MTGDEWNTPAASHTLLERAVHAHVYQGGVTHGQVHVDRQKISMGYLLANYLGVSHSCCLCPWQTLW